jgi:hypothetical protein
MTSYPTVIGTLWKVSQSEFKHEFFVLLMQFFLRTTRLNSEINSLFSTSTRLISIDHLVNEIFHNRQIFNPAQILIKVMNSHMFHSNAAFQYLNLVLRPQIGRLLLKLLCYSAISLHKIRNSGNHSIQLVHFPERLPGVPGLSHLNAADWIPSIITTFVELQVFSIVCDLSNIRKVSPMILIAQDDGVAKCDHCPLNHFMTSRLKTLPKGNRSHRTWNRVVTVTLN